MRTPPNYFSGWSVGTQPELDPPALGRDCYADEGRGSII